MSTRMSSPLSQPHRAAGEPASDRVRLRRKRERGSHDRASIDAILDEALIAHLGIAEEDGQPLVIPTLHARARRRRLLPRLGASRTLRALAGGRAGVPDGVADRRARARALGDAPLGQLPLGDAARGRAAASRSRPRSSPRFEAIVEHIVPGRWRDVRPPTENELQGDGACSRSRSTRPRRRSAPAAAARRRGGLRAAGVGGRDPAARGRGRARARPAAARRHRAAGLRERLPAPGRAVAAQVGGRVHRAPARRLHLEQLEQRPARSRAAGARRARSARRAAGRPAARPRSAPPRRALEQRRAVLPSVRRRAPARAPMCGCSARTARSSSTAGRAGSSRRSSAPIFSA